MVEFTSDDVKARGIHHYVRAQTLLNAIDEHGGSMEPNDLLINALLAIGHALVAEAAPAYGVHQPPFRPEPAKPETLVANEGFIGLGGH